MAKVRNIPKIKMKVKRMLADTAKDPAALDEIGREIIKAVRAKTIAGEQIPKGGKLPSLHPDYVEYRKYAKKSGENVSDLMRPGKAGNIFTGQLLDSLKHRVNDNRVEIEPTGTRDDGSTNKQVAKDLRNKNREFLGIGSEEKETARKIILDTLRRNILKTGL